MASMDVYSSDVFDDLWNVNFESVAMESLKAGSIIVEQKMKQNAKAVVNHAGESEMINSITAKDPKKAKNGAYIVNVGPTGYSTTKTYYAKNRKGTHGKRKNRVSNALKAIWKEYGIPGHQSAQPFITPAVIQTERQVTDIIQKTFEKQAKL